MKPASFAYARPSSLDEALSLLAENAGRARLLAGGQSLGPMLNLRLATPELVIDIGRLAELQRVETTDGVQLVGAGVCHADIEDGCVPDVARGLLQHVARGIAYRAVRNRGTIGGSLAHADPAADWPLALAALGAEVVLRGPDGERRVPAAGLMKAAFTTEIADDEILTAVLVPKLSAAARFGYFKFCRKTGEFPEASAAAVIDPERDATRVFLGALPGPPRPLPALARRISEGDLTGPSRDAAAEAVAGVADLDPIERRMHAGALLRALERAFAP